MKKIYRRVVCIIVTILLLASGTLLSTKVCFAAESPSVSAKSACLIDAMSGTILFQKNAEEKRPMASTTKVMTAILAIESGKMDELVIVPKGAEYVEGTALYLKEGEKLYLRDLVWGLLLNSGNDAAYTIACYLGGSIEGFAKIMNDQAKKIGAVNTIFKNPHGLHEEGHETTAYDLALISAYCMQNEMFAEIVGTKTKTAKTYMDERTLYFSNHNKLLKMYEYAVGIKTGFTKKAGRCLVGAAKKETMLVVAVTLGGPDDWNDHMNMFDFAFNNFTYEKIISRGEFFKTIAIKNGETDRLRLVSDEDFYALKSNEKGMKIEIRYTVPIDIEAPFMKGEYIGVAQVIMNNRQVKSIKLVSSEGVNRVEKLEYKNFFSDFIKNWLMMPYKRGIIKRY